MGDFCRAKAPAFRAAVSRRPTVGAVRLVGLPGGLLVGRFLGQAQSLQFGDLRVGLLFGLLLASPMLVGLLLRRGEHLFGLGSR